MTNFADRTIWAGDNLDILRRHDSASVYLIYLDPPFNSNRNYAVPVGSASFRGNRRLIHARYDQDEASGPSIMQ